MKCNECGATSGFLVMVTDYKPLEMWEFNEGSLTRYCQKDADDKDLEISCGNCSTQDIDYEGFDIDNYSDRPLVFLSDDEWDGKIAEAKTEDSSDESSEESEAAEEASEEPDTADESEEEEAAEEEKE